MPTLAQYFTPKEGIIWQHIRLLTYRILSYLLKQANLSRNTKLTKQRGNGGSASESAIAWNNQKIDAFKFPGQEFKQITYVSTEYVTEPQSKNENVKNA